MSTQNSIIRVMEEKWELIGKREEEFCLFGRRENGSYHDDFDPSV